MNKHYVTEALKHLSSKDAKGDDIYQKLPFDYTQKFVREVQQAVDLAVSNNGIDESMGEMLVFNDAKPGNIYFLPKIHKNINPPPDRPICNTINSPTKKFIQMGRLTTAAICKETKILSQNDNDLLRKFYDINQRYQFPKKVFLVTRDVKSLYTSIPHKDGLGALKKTLEEENVDENKATADFSKLVLTSNYFKFLGQAYLQKSGIAMGTKMAPTYANLFMRQLEKKMIASFPHKPLVYFRYIDDIFMIWTEGEDTLNQFLNHCNNFNPSIQFEQTVFNTNVPFLDVNIILEN